MWSGLLSVLILASIVETSVAVPVHLLPGIDAEAFDVVVVGNPPSRQSGDAPTEPTRAGGDGDGSEKHADEHDEENEEWRNEQELTEAAMGKRSIALGRSGFRPGKRAVNDGLVHPLVNYDGLMMKRSMAIGRLGLRPGKRSMTFGRLNFRPGKRSMAYGRQGFRPGKRSVEVPDYVYQPSASQLFFY